MKKLDNVANIMLINLFKEHLINIYISNKKREKKAKRMRPAPPFKNRC